MGRYEKIKLIHILYVIFLILLLFLFVVLCVFICSFLGSGLDWLVYISVFIAFVLMFVFFGVSYLIFKKLLRKNKSDSKTFSFNMRLSYSKAMNEVADATHAKIFYRDGWRLNTVCIYQAEGFDVKNAKKKMRNCRRELKLKIPSANRNLNRKDQHWRLDLHIFIFGERPGVEDDSRDFVRALNIDNNYGMGKFRAAYFTSDETMIIRTYDGDDLDLYNFFTYDKCLKTLCSLFDLSYSDLINQL